MYLDFARFIQEHTIVDVIERYSVIHFVASEYPALFFTQVRDIIKRGTIIETIDVSHETHQQCIARLSTSFLGAKIIFILKGLDESSAATQNIVWGYLSGYAGPHTLLFSTSRDVYSRQKEQFIHLSQSNIIIDIPDKIDGLLFIDVVKWLGLSPNHNVKKVSARFFDFAKYISLEQACAIIRHMPFGMHDELLLEELLHTLVVPEQSLFILSQYFFQKNMYQFLAQWKQAAQAYAPAFWVSFWSDQLWRAALFVHFSKAGNHVEARKIAFRLPFSFTNKDWRNYTACELTAAHDFLYKLDYRMKNSDASVGLDLFYFTFLSKSTQSMPL